MRILVAWGSKRGGTEGIARMIGDELNARGFTVALSPAARVSDLDPYDAAIIGGALYGFRWHRNARRLVTRHVNQLRRIPVWMFSSGPLDDSADRRDIPPLTSVAVLMDRIGALGHVTFGGRLEADARGLAAAAMARQHSGDWRNPLRIRAWASQIARALPSARPHAAIAPPARSLGRLLGHGAAAWVLCTAALAAFMGFSSHGLAMVLHAILVPIVFGAFAVHYFRQRGAREPLPTAIAWTVLAALLDATVVAGLIVRGTALLSSVAGSWLPWALILLATWATGVVMQMVPPPGAPRSSPRPPRTPRPPPRIPHPPTGGPGGGPGRDRGDHDVHVPLGV